MLRKLVIAAVLLGILAGVATVAWQACGMPPLRLVLKYGYPSPMGPTGRTLTVEGVEFVEISPGYFRMGSHFLCDRGNLLGRVCALICLPWGRQPKHNVECPIRWTELPDAFWLARTELTNVQFSRVIETPSQPMGFLTASRPALIDRTNQALLYCSRLSSLCAFRIRPPTEPEWEACCRAGTTTEYSFGDDPRELRSFAVCRDNSSGTPRRVGSCSANPWGFFDMHGNVFELSSSLGGHHHRESCTGTSETSPCPSRRTADSSFVYRGGSCFYPASICRSATRARDVSGFTVRVRGLRPAFTIDVLAEIGTPPSGEEAALPDR